MKVSLEEMKIYISSTLRDKEHASFRFSFILIMFPKTTVFINMFCYSLAFSGSECKQAHVSEKLIKEYSISRSKVASRTADYNYYKIKTCQHFITHSINTWIYSCCYNIWRDNKLLTSMSLTSTQSPTLKACFEEIKKN